MKNVSIVIDKAIDKIVKETSSIEKISSIIKRHDDKIHFIPKRYRVFSGLMQSMNIKFGDFIEQLFQEIVTYSEEYTLEELSGNHSKKYKILKENDAKIDAYITDRQNMSVNKDFEKELEKQFNSLINSINNNCLKETTGEYYEVRHDIDLFFKENNKDNYYYAEIKYNDDHDSGKFVDISRKFIKTYTYLYDVLLDKYDKDYTKFKLKPCMFFFTNKRMMENIYIPEKTNIYRGTEIFKNFFTYIDYDDIYEYLSNISEEDETIKKFDNLYKDVMEITKKGTNS